MEKTLESAKELMEKGWRAREDLRFDEAESLLNAAKGIFTDLGDWYNVTECLNHLAYTSKLRSQNLLETGKALTDESLKMAKDHQAKEHSALRASISLLSAQSNYEQALQQAKELLELYTKPANRADILIHIAQFEMRTGHLDNAKAAIEQAAALLDEGWDFEKEPARSIWKASLLLTNALILFNFGDTDQGKKVAYEALEFSQQQNLKTRIAQAQTLIAMFDS